MHIQSAQGCSQRLRFQQPCTVCVAKQCRSYTFTDENRNIRDPTVRFKAWPSEVHDSK